MQRNPSTPSAVPASLRCSGAGGIAIIPTAPERPRNRDTDSSTGTTAHFYYLTGFAEPGAVLVLTAEGHSTLFLPAQGPGARNLGRGPPGPRRRARSAGGECCAVLAVLDAQLPRLLENRSCVWYPFATHTGLAARVEGWLNAVRARVRYGAMRAQRNKAMCAPCSTRRASSRSAHELDIMRRASQISAQGPYPRDAAGSPWMSRAGAGCARIPPGCRAAARLPRRRLRDTPPDGSIVAAGANACVLHYRADAGRCAMGSWC